MKNILIYFIALIIPIVGNSASLQLNSQIQQIAALCGGIDDFYFKYDSRDAKRREIADNLWRCIPYSGELSSDHNISGITIRGASCPIDFIRAYNKVTFKGSAQYKSSEAKQLLLAPVEEFNSQFTLQDNSDQEKDDLKTEIQTVYQLKDGSALNLKIKHSLILAKKNTYAHRVTLYEFSDAASSVTLKYTVDSDLNSYQKKCFVDSTTQPCDDFFQTYGPIELIPNW